MVKLSVFGGALKFLFYFSDVLSDKHEHCKLYFWLSSLENCPIFQDGFGCTQEFFLLYRWDMAR